MRNNVLLKQYILNKYGSIAKFLKKEKFSPQDLETVFNNNNIFHEMGMGIKICRALNIDAERLFCHNEIAALKSGSEENADGSLNMPLDDIIKEKFALLSDEKRKKALDYADFIFENGDGNE